MRFLIGGLLLFCSVIIGYIIYDKYRSNSQSNVFFMNFAQMLAQNTEHEMLSFCEVFNETYERCFSINPNLTDTDSALLFVKENLGNAEGFDEIFSLIKSYIDARSTEIDGVEASLIEITREYASKSQKILKERGVTSTVLFPSAFLIVIILLI